MKFRFHFLPTLLICFSSSLFNTAYAEVGRIQGKVTETMNAAGYTYVEVDTGENKVWAAAPTTEVKIGDHVEFSTVMPMKNFQSKALNRDFPVVYFAQHFIMNNKSLADSKDKPTATTVKIIAKVKDGHSIAEIYNDRNKLANKTIQVRGQVTKFTANILKKNWVHIVDGSGTNDLTITTDSIVEVDDIVVVSGTLELNKDFGYGYLYPLIVEDEDNKGISFNRKINHSQTQFRPFDFAR